MALNNNVLCCLGSPLRKNIHPLGLCFYSQFTGPRDARAKIALLKKVVSTRRRHLKLFRRCRRPNIGTETFPLKTKGQLSTEA